MKRYIHGAKNGIYIIDLNKTLSQLDLAIAFLNDGTAWRKSSFCWYKTSKRNI